MLLDIVQSILAQSSTPDFVHDSAVQTGAQILAAFLILFIGDRLSRRDAQKQSKRKEVSYEVLLDTSYPLSILKNISKVELSNGMPIPDDTSMVNIKITNTGGVPVTPQEFYDAIEFEFVGRTALTCSVINQEPSRVLKQDVLEKFLKIQKGTKIRLPEFLLDVGDAITIQVLVEGQTNEIKGQAIIPGGKFIRADKRTPVKAFPILSTTIILILIISALRLFSVYLSTVPAHLDLPDIVLITLLLFVLSSLVICFILFRKRILFLIKNGKITW